MAIGQRKSSRYTLAARVLALVIAALVGTVVGGCGRSQELAKISGKVTFNDQPVTEGNVIFSDPVWGTYLVAPIRNDGTYAITATAEGGPYVDGVYKIAVTPPAVEAPMGVSKPAAALTSSYANIPRQYRKLETTPLKLEVKTNRVEYDVAMTP